MQLFEKRSGVLLLGHTVYFVQLMWHVLVISVQLYKKVDLFLFGTVYTNHCLGGAAVRCWTRDRKVASSTPGRGATKSIRSTQPSIPPG